MGLPHLTEDQKQEALDAVEKYGTISAAAKVLGIPRTTLRDRIYRAKQGFCPIIPGKSILYNAETGSEKLIWATGKGMQGPTVEEITDSVTAALRDFKPPKLLKQTVAGDKDLLGIWPLADLHMGMRAWGLETGGPDWDIGIATQAYQEGLDEVTAMTPKLKVGVVLVAGDLAHADNYHQTTTNPATHHIVDVDGRYPKMLEASVEIVMYAAMRALERCERIEVVILPGNHDGATAVAVRLVVAALFEGDKRVNVSKSPSRYWWYEWGKCMFACTHGDKNNIRRLPGYMADQMCEMWGRTKYRYAFTGHFHKKLIEEHPGVRVEILPTPVAPDSFSSDYGFKAPRMFETKVYHKERGLRHTPTVIL